MKNQLVKVHTTENGVSVVLLDRPKANAISPDMLEELYEVASELKTRKGGAVIFWGGEKIFAAGADISQFYGSRSPGEIGQLFHKAMDQISQIPCPTIAAIAGYALGGGCELALACDFRIASPEAKLGQPEILLGIIPGGGATQRLPRLIGPSRAKDLIFSGRQVKVEEALSIGLIDRIAPSNEQLLATSINWADSFVKGPSIALRLAKHAIDKGIEITLDKGMDLELGLFEEAFKTKDAAIGIKSFLENGPGKAIFVGE